MKESKVSDKGEEKKSNQSKLLFKLKQSTSLKVNKSSTKHSSPILGRGIKKNVINEMAQVDEERTIQQADDEYKSDTSDEEVGYNVIYSGFQRKIYKCDDIKWRVIFAIYFQGHSQYSR